MLPLPNYFYLIPLLPRRLPQRLAHPLSARASPRNVPPPRGRRAARSNASRGSSADRNPASPGRRTPRPAPGWRDRPRRRRRSAAALRAWSPPDLALARARSSDLFGIAVVLLARWDCHSRQIVATARWDAIAGRAGVVGPRGGMDPRLRGGDGREGGGGARSPARRVGSRRGLLRRGAPRDDRDGGGPAGGATTGGQPAEMPPALGLLRRCASRQ